MNFSVTLQELRKKTGLSTRALARRTGGAVSASYITLLEKGYRKKPSTEVIGVLSEALSDDRCRLARAADVDRIDPDIAMLKAKAKKMARDLLREEKAIVVISNRMVHLSWLTAQALGRNARRQRAFLAYMFAGMVEQGHLEKKTVKGLDPEKPSSWTDRLPQSPFHVVWDYLNDRPPDLALASELAEYLEEEVPKILTDMGLDLEGLDLSLEDPEQQGPITLDQFQSHIEEEPTP